MKTIWLAFLVIIVVLLIIMMFAGPSLTMDGSLATSKAGRRAVNSNAELSRSSAASQNWAVTTCNEATQYTTLAAAQKVVQKNQYITDRGTKYVICNLTSAALPDCPTCPACPSCPSCAPCPACNCPAARDCPACPACPAQKDCPACNCPAQKDCPACNCPTCPAPKDCPACTSSCNCPACPEQKDCPNIKCPDAAPCPACPELQPQPIEFVVQGNVSKV
jgi:hypothetical protein